MPGPPRRFAGGKSLLPAGVTRIEGAFSRGDCVAICDERGAEIGRGLVAFDALHAERIRGRNSHDIANLLGVAGPGRNDPSRRHDARRALSARLARLRPFAPALA